MTEAVTYLTPEDAAMWAAAGLAQLPRKPFPQVRTIREPAWKESAALRERDEAPVPPAMPCACGCGEPVARARTGRPACYVSSAHRMRALRARRRG